MWALLFVLGLGATPMANAWCQCPYVEHDVAVLPVNHLQPTFFLLAPGITALDAYYGHIPAPYDPKVETMKSIRQIYRRLVINDYFYDLDKAFIYCMLSGTALEGTIMTGALVLKDKMYGSYVAVHFYADCGSHSSVVFGNVEFNPVFSAEYKIIERGDGLFRTKEVPTDEPESAGDFTASSASESDSTSSKSSSDSTSSKSSSDSTSSKSASDSTSSKSASDSTSSKSASESIEITDIMIDTTLLG
jgi:hypothetical protein